MMFPEVLFGLVRSVGLSAKFWFFLVQSIGSTTAGGSHTRSCFQWTTADADESGRCGTTAKLSNNDWSDNNSEDCNGFYPFYCVSYTTIVLLLSFLRMSLIIIIIFLYYSRRMMNEFYFFFFRNFFFGFFWSNSDRFRPPHQQQLNVRFLILFFYKIFLFK